MCGIQLPSESSRKPILPIWIESATDPGALKYRIKSSLHASTDGMGMATGMQREASCVCVTGDRRQGSVLAANRFLSILPNYSCRKQVPGVC